MNGHTFPVLRLSDGKAVRQPDISQAAFGVVVYWKGERFWLGKHYATVSRLIKAVDDKMPKGKTRAFFISRTHLVNMSIWTYT